jgi:hypothetical protein
MRISVSAMPWSNGYAVHHHHRQHLEDAAHDEHPAQHFDANTLRYLNGASVHSTLTMAMLQKRPG